MIQLRQNYTLASIGGTPCLLPYGQNIADFCRSIRLNESGCILYRALSYGADENDLLNALISHYHADDSDIPALKEDIKIFLSQLKALGILLETDDEAETAPNESDCFFCIGPIVLAYRGPKELLFGSMYDFTCNCQKPNLSFEIICDTPSVHPTGEILIRNDELCICRTKTSYLFLYPAGYGIAEAHISPDGRKGVFYCPKPHDKTLSEKLFHAFRFAFLIYAQKNDLFAIHSASVLYRDKAWLFCAPSGVGKSTHAALWHKLYHTPYLNGDVNLIGFSEHSPVVYGIPWCGTSGLYTADTVPLGGIVFLNRSRSDHAFALPQDTACLNTIQRMISPAWTEDMLLANLAFSEKLCRSVPFFRLECTKNDSAAQRLKLAVDAVL